MLEIWTRVLRQFPVSSLSPGVRELTVYPFGWAESPVLEQSFTEGAQVEDVVPLAAEFLHDDYAYEAELNWDVWVPRADESLDAGADPESVPDIAQSLAQWERLPQRVGVTCLGPQFEQESDQTPERPHLLLNLGLDTLFLPDIPDIDEEFVAEALEGVAGNCYRENIAQLLGYLRQLEKGLPLTRRLLWSSSGEDLAARIRAAYG